MNEESKPNNEQETPDSVNPSEQTSPPPIPPMESPKSENVLGLKVLVWVLGAIVLFLLVILFRKAAGLGGNLNSDGVVSDSTAIAPSSASNIAEIEEEATTLPSTSSEKPESKQGQVQKFTFRETSFVGYRAHSNFVNIQLHYKDAEGRLYRTLGAVRETIEGNGNSFLFATNGGIFHSDYSPVGLCIIDGQEISPLNKDNGNGNFFLKPNGVFYLLDDGELGVLSLDDYREAGLVPKYATQSGPMLLVNGEVHPAFNADSPNKFIRSAVGAINDREVIFLISSEPVRFYDFAMVFRDEFNCKNALYLDGVISDVLLEEEPAEEAVSDFSTIISIFK